MNEFKRNILMSIVDTALPVFNFYYKGVYPNDDPIHHPEVNSWVDYIGDDGLLHRQIIGGIEEGCQLVLANSIVGFNDCATCIP